MQTTSVQPHQGATSATIHHDVTIPGPPQLQEVDDGVFAYIQPDGTWWINNTGFLVGQRGVISIDTCATVRRTRAYLDAIRTVTPQPVRTVINTVDRRALRASSPPANLLRHRVSGAPVARSRWPALICSVTASANMDPFFIDHAVGSVGRALEDRLPHLCANLVGTGDGLTFVGGSRVVAPTGVIAVEASRDKEELLLVPETGGYDERTHYPASSDRRFQSGR